MTLDRNALVVDNVHRAFGKLKANDGVSLSVAPGHVVGLLGHNGAGKTTLVSQIVGLLRPDSGAISVQGIDVVEHPGEARSLVSVQSQSHAPVDGLKPRGAIEITARLRGASRSDALRATESIAAELEIEPWLDRRALPEGAGLSGGIRRLTSFAMAIASPTPVLVLDEPTNDVDAHRRRLLWAAVRRRADEGAAVLLVTHNISEIEKIVDKLVILDQGRVIAQGTVDELRGNADQVRLTVSGGEPSAERPFVAADGGVVAGSRVLTVRMRDLEAATRWAISQQEAGNIESFSINPTTLEDVYLGRTSKKEESNNG